MEKLNLPPFYVGQRVVALESLIKIKKGELYHVAEVFKCHKCNCWYVTVSELDTSGIFSCNLCHAVLKWSNIKKGAPSSCFAPLESTFQSISFEKVVELESPLIGVN